MSNSQIADIVENVTSRKSILYTLRPRYHCPVTEKVFTDNTHVSINMKSGHVYAVPIGGTKVRQPCALVSFHITGLSDSKSKANAMQIMLRQTARCANATGAPS